MYNNTLLLAILIPPFACAATLLVAIVLGWTRNPRLHYAAALLAPAAILVSVAAAIRASVDLVTRAAGASASVEADFGPWFATDALSVRLHFSLDVASALPLIALGLVGLAITLRAVRSRKRETSRLAAAALLSAAVGSAFIALLAGNLILLFAGWHGIAFFGFALAAHRPGGAARANDRFTGFVASRAGDIALIVGIVTTHLALGSLEIADLARPHVLASAGPGLGIAGVAFALGLVTAVGVAPLGLRLTTTASGTRSERAALLALTIVPAIAIALRLQPLLAHAAVWIAPALGVAAAIGVALAGAMLLTERRPRVATAHLATAWAGLGLIAASVGATAAATMIAITAAFAIAALGLVVPNRNAAASLIDRITHVVALLVLGGLPLLSGLLALHGALSAAFSAGATWSRIAGWIAFGAVPLLAAGCARQIAITRAPADAARDRIVRGGAPALFLAGLAAIVGYLNVPAALAGARGAWLDRQLGASTAAASDSWTWLGVIAAVIVAALGVGFIAVARSEALGRVLRRRGPLGRLHAASIARFYFDGVIHRRIRGGTRRLAGFVAVVDDFLVDGFIARGVFGVLVRIGGEGIRIAHPTRVGPAVLLVAAAVAVGLLGVLW